MVIVNKRNESNLATTSRRAKENNLRIILYFGNTLEPIV
jgi:hypothetical protein